MPGYRPAKGVKGKKKASRFIRKLRTVNIPLDKQSWLQGVFIYTTLEQLCAMDDAARTKLIAVYRQGRDLDPEELAKVLMRELKAAGVIRPASKGRRPKTRNVRTRG